MSDRGVETLRSDFLVHWTGKDIQKDYRKLRDCQTQRQEYVHRLETTLDPLSGGLWMNDIEAKLLSSDRVGLDGGHYLKFFWPATCFTEIKLSNTLNHTRLYGCLGFGFSREFVISRYGAPVQYVPGVKEADAGALDNISPNLFKLFAVLKFFRDKTLELQSLDFPHGVYKEIENCHFIEFIENSDLEQFLKAHDYERDAKYPQQIFAYLTASVMACAIFVKRMSDYTSFREFHFLDEAEWRIPYTDSMLNEGKLRKTNVIKPRYKIPFKAGELKIIILPDDETRKQALECQHILDWLLKDSTNLPIIVTVEECLHF